MSDTARRDTDLEEFEWEFVTHEPVSDNPVAFHTRIKSADYYPTDARPGSETKVDIMIRRHAGGLPIWHAQDRCDFAESCDDEFCREDERDKDESATDEWEYFD